MEIENANKYLFVKYRQHIDCLVHDNTMLYSDEQEAV